MSKFVYFFYLLFLFIALQNSWQVPYISLYARIFCDAFQLFDFHQEVNYNINKIKDF
jgi:hypothetical protein